MKCLELLSKWQIKRDKLNMFTMKSIEKFAFLLILVLSWSSTAFSQKATCVNGDTLICFSTDQSKFLLQQVYRVEELDTLLKLEQAENLVLKNQIALLNQNVEIYQQRMVNEQQINNQNSALLATSEKEIKILNRRLRFQKVKTYIIGGIGVVTSSIFLYLYVTK